MMHKLKALIILGVLVFSFHVPCFGQSEILNDQEVIRINTLLKKHSRNADSINFYANELLKYSKQNNLKFWEYSAYVALGNSERIKNNTIQSNNFYHTALGIAKAIQDEKAQHMVMNNIALNHKRLRRNDSAFYYFKKLNAYHTKQLEVLPASMAKQNIGQTFLQYQELDSANYYLQQAQKGFKELNNLRFIAQNLNLLGEVQLQSKHYDTALKYADSSLTLANENDLKFLLPSNYALLSRIYSNMGNDEKAKEYSDLAHTNRPREIDHSESSIGTLNEEARVQSAKAYESRLNETEDSKEFYKSNLFIAAILILVLAFVVYSFFKRHKAIENEFKDIQLKLDAMKANEVIEEVENPEKVIHLKSKATINASNILYIKSDGHYVEYHLDDRKQPEVDRSTMMEVEKSLPAQCFVRIHKSYIVNIHRIKIINSSKLMLDTGEWINLSRVYKQTLKDLLNKE